MTNKVIAVVAREYLTRVRTKGFIIGTLITPFFMILIFGGVFIFALLFKPETKKFLVIDQSGKIYENMVSMLNDTLQHNIPEFKWAAFKMEEDQSLDSAIVQLQKKVSGNEVDAYLVIPENIIENREIRYAARSVSNWEEQQKIEWAISKIVTDYRLMARGLSPDSIRNELDEGKVKLVTSQVTETGEISKSGTSSFILTYLLAYILFLIVMIYGQIVSRSVIEEKSQRITEMILSSIKPIELLLGKIIGICLLGLTQLFIIGLFFLLASAYAAYGFISLGINSAELLDIVNQIKFSVSVFGFLLLYFILGFLFYSALYAMVGSIVTTEDEAQQMQMIFVFLLIIGFFMMFSAAKNPESSTALWLSMIPFFSPIVGFARIAVSDPILPDGAFLSILILILSVVGTIWFVSKIYRVGILMYGKKPSLKELIRWVRHS
jgi:ABC-2 type transport system permease protein